MGLLPGQTGALESQLGDARRRIEELESELVQSTIRDQLTGSLLAPRAFRARLELDVQRAHRYRRPLSVAIVDIDGFRSINLERGYGAGDSVLVATAGKLAELTRVNDLACRMGGDEFAVLMPETGSRAALRAAERILLALEALDTGSVRGVSVSIGVAALRPGHAPERLLAFAENALEQARAGGGGCAAVHADGDDSQEFWPDPSGGDVVAALAAALHERDNYPRYHAESVVGFAGRVAESLGIDEVEISRLRTAALLHDIGKVGVPDEVLHKPGPLDEREWELMRRHPEIGERILRGLPGLGGVAKIVRHAHERWDGRGYPDGISGEDIPIGARIILACCAYQAMLSDRPYRAATSHADAVAEITRHAGTQFDPGVAEALGDYLYGRRQTAAAGL